MPQGYLQFPNIDPVLFSIGPLAVRWYGLMYLVGFLFAMWLANRRADRAGSGWTREQVSDLLFAGFLGVVIGGRVGYVISTILICSLLTLFIYSKCGLAVCPSTAAYWV